MTIQTIIHDGISVKTRTYRNIYFGKNYHEVINGFLMQSSFSKWGEAWKLTGKKRELIATFGKVEK